MISGRDKFNFIWCCESKQWSLICFLILCPYSSEQHTSLFPSRKWGCHCYWPCAVLLRRPSKTRLKLLDSKQKKINKRGKGSTLDCTVKAKFSIFLPLTKWREIFFLIEKKCLDFSILFLIQKKQCGDLVPTSLLGHCFLEQTFT